MMTEGDPIIFTFKVKDAAAWAAGSFTAHVKDEPRAAATALVTMSVACVANGADADFTLTASQAAASVLVGSVYEYFWDLQEVNGVTRFAGRFWVKKQVTT